MKKQTKQNTDTASNPSIEDIIDELLRESESETPKSSQSQDLPSQLSSSKDADANEILRDAPSKREVSEFPLFSQFERCDDNTASCQVILPSIVQAIQEGLWKRQVDEIIDELNSKGKDAANALKKKILVGFTFSKNGNRKKDDDKSLCTHTGYLIIDIDAAENPTFKIQDMIEKFKNDPHLLAGFLSPTGTGYKLIMLIEPRMETHKQYFESAKIYFRDKFGLIIDTSGSDLNRLCYASFDPDAWMHDRQTRTIIPLALETIPEKSLSKLTPEMRHSPVPVPSDVDFDDLARTIAEQNEFKKEFAKKCERGAKYYDLFVREKTFGFKPGTRHHVSIKLINLLYQTVTPKLVEIYMQQFWYENQKNIKATSEEHLKECRSMIESTELNYLKTLSPGEINFYMSLDPDQQCVFRICRGLASLTENVVLGEFYLGNDGLGKRMATTSPEGGRYLKDFEKWGVIKLLKKGKRGQGQKASTFKWNGSFLLNPESVTPR